MSSAAFAKKLREDLRNFEDGAIVLRRNISAKLREGCGIEHPLHTRCHILKAFQDDPHIFLLDPFRVVALLGKRPSIALDQHCKLADDGLRNTAGTERYHQQE